MTPGDEEQWTISVQHTEDDVQKYIDAFGRVLPGARGLTHERHRGSPHGPALRAGPSVARRRRHDAADARVHRGDRATGARDRGVRARPHREPAAAGPDGLGRGARRAAPAQTITPDGHRLARRRCASGPRCWRRRRSPPTTRRRSRSCPARPRRRRVLFDLIVGASSTIAAGLDRRRRRDLGREPGAAVGRRPGRASPRAPAASSCRAARRATSRRWSTARHAAAERRGGRPDRWRIAACDTRALLAWPRPPA